MIQLAILISGGGSNLQAIIESIDKGQINARIAIVISDQSAAYGLKRAEKADIKNLHLPKKSKESREEYDQRLAQELKKHNVDLIVLAGFMRILSADFVTKYEGKVINVHPSLLPAYTGLNTHARVLRDKKTLHHGASVHVVTTDVDQGPLIVQEKTTVQSNDTPESLQQRVHQIEYQILPKVIAEIADGTISLADYCTAPRTSFQPLNFLTSYLSLVRRRWSALLRPTLSRLLH